MERVSFIIPVHEFNGTVKEYLVKALNSVKDMKDSDTFDIIFTGPSDIVNSCEEVYNEVQCPQKLIKVETQGTDLYENINLAAQRCSTSYFSVLEFDDEYFPYWNICAQRLLEKNRYSVLMSIVELRGTKGKPIGLMNEIAWDAAFAENIGALEIKELEAFRDFNVTGGYIKTSDFISVGGLKSSMKIAAWYELLLRMANNEKEIYVSPRIGYKHTVMRENSYMVIQSEAIKQEEGEWLIKYALDDYVNKVDSGKTYEPENKEE